MTYFSTPNRGRLGGIAIATAGIALVALFAPSGANALPLTLISHDAVASSTAMVNGSTLTSATDVDATPTDTYVFAHSASASAPGPSQAHADSQAVSKSFDTASETVVQFEQYAHYFGSIEPGGPNPGGDASADLSATWVFELAAVSVDVVYGNTFLDLGGAFAGGSTLRIENLTSNASILDLVDPGPILPTTLSFTGLIGDLIQISYFGYVSGAVASGGDVSGYRDFYELRFAGAGSPASGSVPEPAAVLLLGLGLVGLAWRRQRSRG
ncbi:MAG: PEP-CTERM sorting domain-containing protein [Alphaproteobacteria bacterium]|jgi:hypothetical protein|nr:PEP-CTERM sorting domain-containing protein [Alphaproteobacteria bacterium]MDP6567630.1 PEP-CTERM sorting domain-containing protein [Alphaproteobacteria bacterium]MDP6812579.1 PEP-CTERM sorting domain-containing protein [Alphaproteobacteria bacterium]